MSLAPDFRPDEPLQQFAQKSAERCTQFLKLKFGKTADYSDAFVAEVEAVLDLLHKTMPVSKPSQEDIQEFSTMFGSYLGETYRRNHGGEWGISQDTPALSFGSGYKSFPWIRVFKRLTNGEEDDVVSWYQGMIGYGRSGDGGNASSAVPPPPPAKKGFFSRFLGR